MDAVAHFDRLERDDTDISFSMKFTKARERTPANRDDFLRAGRRRIGQYNQNKTYKTDCRVILATNEDLSKAVAEGRFRQDLYYRINVINVELPPLRERLSDIPLLAKHFLEEIC